jgi:hypothetical protein
MSKMWRITQVNLMINVEMESQGTAEKILPM